MVPMATRIIGGDVQSFRNRTKATRAVLANGTIEEKTINRAVKKIARIRKYLLSGGGNISDREWGTTGQRKTIQVRRKSTG